MPIYVYRCAECGAELERKQGFNDAPLLVCPNGHRALRRVYSPAAILFKGSGFYITDYARKGSAGESGGTK